MFAETNTRKEDARERFRRMQEARGFEAYSCAVPLSPGDAVFFREDTWHRTQDVLHDRVSLIIDVLRLPLR